MLRGSLSQTDMANNFNMTLRTYQRYEAGERTPPWSVLNAIAQKYSKTVDWILTGKKSPWWTYVPSVSRESLEWMHNQLDTDVIKAVIVTYHDNNFGNPQGFVLVKSNGIVSMAGTATRSGYLGGGPNTYCDILEIIKTKHIPTGIVELSEEESANIDEIDVTLLIDRARFADNTIDSELARVRPDKYNTNEIRYDIENKEVLRPAHFNVPPEIQPVFDAFIEVMTSDHEGVKLALTQNTYMFQETVRSVKKVSKLENDIKEIKRVLGTREDDFKTLGSQGEKKQGGGNG